MDLEMSELGGPKNHLVTSPPCMEEKTEAMGGEQPAQGALVNS